MLNVKRCLSLSVSALALSAGTSLAAYQDNISSFPASITDTNTTHTSVQSSAPFIKLANACFIKDVSECQGQKYGNTEEYPDFSPDEYIPKPNKDKCLELGFNLTTCSEGHAPYKHCPYDSRYFRECVCSESCPEGYRQELCSGTEKQLDMKVQNCTVCYKCGAYDDTCPAGYVMVKNSSKCYETVTKTTEAGSICYKEKACCNDTCSGYTSIPSTSVCEDGYDTMQVCGKDCYTCKDCICSGYTSTMTALFNCGGKGYTRTTVCGKDCYVCNKCTATTCDRSYNLASPDTGGGKSCTSCTPKGADCSNGTTMYKCSCPEVACPDQYETSCGYGYTDSKTLSNDCGKSAVCYKCCSAPSVPSGYQASCSNGYTDSKTVTNDCGNSYTYYKCKAGYTYPVKIYCVGSCVWEKDGPAFTAVDGRTYFTRWYTAKAKGHYVLNGKDCGACSVADQTCRYMLKNSDKLEQFYLTIYSDENTNKYEDRAYQKCEADRLKIGDTYTVDESAFLSFSGSCGLPSVLPACEP